MKASGKVVAAAASRTHSTAGNSRAARNCNAKVHHAMHVGIQRICQPHSRGRELGTGSGRQPESRNLNTSFKSPDAPRQLLALMYSTSGERDGEIAECGLAVVILGGPAVPDSR